MVKSVGADPKSRVKGAVIDLCQRGAFGAKAFTHPIGQRLILGLVEIASADAGLVCGDDHRPAELVCGKARQRENSGNEFELIDAVDIAVIDIDDAIAIEKQGASP